MNLTLNINAKDYGFVIEAIKLRTMSLIESLDAQKENQLGVAIQTKIHPESPFTAAPVKAEGEPVKFIGKPAKKKLHWTQTPEGKVKMANRTRKGTK
jgi:hypothetical protein